LCVGGVRRSSMFGYKDYFSRSNIVLVELLYWGVFGNGRKVILVSVCLYFRNSLSLIKEKIERKEKEKKKRKKEEKLTKRLLVVTFHMKKLHLNRKNFSDDCCRVEEINGRVH
jgi:hypothetical protein